MTALQILVSTAEHVLTEWMDTTALVPLDIMEKTAVQVS